MADDQREPKCRRREDFSLLTAWSTHHTMKNNLFECAVTRVENFLDRSMNSSEQNRDMEEENEWMKEKKKEEKSKVKEE